MSKKFEKRRRNVSCDKEEEKSGYCQVCGRYFNDLAEHARASQHGPYPPIQYPQLESIFDYCDLNNMGCLKKSLRIVKSPPSEIFEKPSLELPVVPMNGRIPHSKIDKATLYNGFFSSKRNNFDRSDSAEEDEDEDQIFSKDESSEESENGSKCLSKRPKKVSRKRLSVEEKLIEDNKSYYRVEVLNSKLRSTKYIINRKQLESKMSDDGTVNEDSSDESETSREENQQQKPEEDPKQKKEPVVVRFKKVRKSQLTAVSNKAETFMLKKPVPDQGTKDVSTSPAQWSDTDSFNSTSDEEELPKMKKMVGDSANGSPSNECLGSNSTSSPPTLNCDHDSISELEDSTDDCSRNRITLDSISFLFENPPKHEPWLETYTRQKEGKTKYHYPYYHEYPKVLLPYEYPSSDRLKLLSGKKASGFSRQRGRWGQDDNRARKSPRCHASTLAVMSNFLKRPLRECSKTSDFSYEEESRSSLPDTVDTSSSTSEFRSNSSFACDPNMLPDDSCGDVFALALARVVCGETSSLHIPPGPCLAVDSDLLDNPPPGLGINLRPGPTVPMEAIINHHSNDTSWMDYDYSRAEEETKASHYLLPDSGLEEKGCADNVPYSWPELPLRRRRKRIKKEEEPPPPIVPRVLIKCEPCEIKLEPMSPKILEKFSIKHNPLPIKKKAVAIKKNNKKEQPAEGVKRGRGRPRKIIPSVDIESQLANSPSISQQPPTKTYFKKSTVSRFPFNQRSFINQIV